jgi:hypothetical protein
MASASSASMSVHMATPRGRLRRILQILDDGLSALDELASLLSGQPLLPRGQNARLNRLKC